MNENLPTPSIATDHSAEVTVNKESIEDLLADLKSFLEKDSKILNNRQKEHLAVLESALKTRKPKINRGIKQAFTTLMSFIEKNSTESDQNDKEGGEKEDTSIPEVDLMEELKKESSGIRAEEEEDTRTGTSGDSISKPVQKQVTISVSELKDNLEKRIRLKIQSKLTGISDLATLKKEVKRIEVEIRTAKNKNRREHGSLVDTELNSFLKILNEERDLVEKRVRDIIIGEKRLKEYYRADDDDIDEYVTKSNPPVEKEPKEKLAQEIEEKLSISTNFFVLDKNKKIVLSELLEKKNNSHPDIKMLSEKSIKEEIERVAEMIKGQIVHTDAYAQGQAMLRDYEDFQSIRHDSHDIPIKKGLKPSEIPPIPQKQINPQPTPEERAILKNTKETVARFSKKTSDELALLFGEKQLTEVEKRLSLIKQPDLISIPDINLNQEEYTNALEALNLPSKTNRTELVEKNEKMMKEYYSKEREVVEKYSKELGIEQEQAMAKDIKRRQEALTAENDGDLFSNKIVREFLGSNFKDMDNKDIEDHWQEILSTDKSMASKGGPYAGLRYTEAKDLFNLNTVMEGIENDYISGKIGPSQYYRKKAKILAGVKKESLKNLDLDKKAGAFMSSMAKIGAGTIAGYGLFKAALWLAATPVGGTIFWFKTVVKPSLKKEGVISK